MACHQTSAEIIYAPLPIAFSRNPGFCSALGSPAVLAARVKRDQLDDAPAIHVRPSVDPAIPEDERIKSEHAGPSGAVGAGPPDAPINASMRVVANMGQQQHVGVL